MKIFQEYATVDTMATALGRSFGFGDMHAAINSAMPDGHSSGTLHHHTMDNIIRHHRVGKASMKRAGNVSLYLMNSRQP